MAGHRQTLDPDGENRYLAWAILIAVMAAVAIIRFHLIDVPFERDEGEYAYWGTQILNGVVPYRGRPGLYAVYAIILKIFGQTHTGVHLALLVLNAAATVLIFLIGRKLFNTLTGALAGAGYAILSLSPSVEGIMANAEHFIVFFAMAGIFVLLRGLGSGKIRNFFFSGLLLGTSFTVKQQGVFFIVFSALYLSWHLLRDWSGAGKFLKTLTAFSIGVFIPFGLVFIIMYSAGIFDKFWYNYFTITRTYASTVTLSEGLLYFRHRALSIFLSTLPIWLISGVGLTSLLWNRQLKERSIFLLGFLFFSLLSITAGLHFHPHYFILLFPSAALFFGVAVDSLTRLSACSYMKKFSFLKTALPVLLVALSLAQPLWADREVLFFAEPARVSHIMYGPNPFPEALEVGRYIKANSEDDDTVAVFGSEPEIYFYSGRTAATGQMYTYLMMEANDVAVELQRDMVREVTASEPLFLVYVNIRYSWNMTEKSNISIFEWLKVYKTAYYDKVGLIEVSETGESKYFWDGDEVYRTPETNYWISVYRRKNR